MISAMLPTLYLFVNTDEGPVQHSMVLARYAFEPERVPMGIEDIHLVVDAGQWILNNMERTETWTMAHDSFVDVYMPGEEAGWAYIADILRVTQSQWAVNDEEETQDAASSKEEPVAVLDTPSIDESREDKEEEVPAARLVIAVGSGYTLCVESVEELSGMAVLSLFPYARLTWRTRLRHAWHILWRGVLPALQMDADLRILKWAIRQTPIEELSSRQASSQPSLPTNHD